MKDSSDLEVRSPEAREILAGAVDLHIHTAPDIRHRKGDDLEITRRASEAGMRAIVLKSHLEPTASRATIAQRLYPGVKVFGGIALNHSCGGLNPLAVEVALQMGAKIVWMPTISAENDLGFTGIGKARESYGLVEGGRGITILDENGGILPAVASILEIVAHKDVILATGHLSLRETLALVSAARSAGVRKILVNHPEIDRTRLPLDVQKQLAEDGAYLERCFVVTKMGPRYSCAQLAAIIREVGPGSTVMATDLGQAGNPWPHEGMLEYISGLLQGGISRTDIQRMAKSNPAALLNL